MTAGTRALLSPHNSEVWSRLEAFDFRGGGPRLTEYTAGCLRMVTEQVTSDDYEAAWKDIRSALSPARFPLGRVTLFISLGSGRHISLWLASSRSAFDSAGPPEQAVARVLGATKAAELFARLRAASGDVQVAELIARPELASPE